MQTCYVHNHVYIFSCSCIKERSLIPGITVYIIIIQMFILLERCGHKQWIIIDVNVLNKAARGCENILYSVHEFSRYYHFIFNAMKLYDRTVVEQSRVYAESIHFLSVLSGRRVVFLWIIFDVRRE